LDSWSKVIALSAGGVLGVNARYWLGQWINEWAGAQFPWATFAINVSGSFAIGFLTLTVARWLPHPNVRLLVITGFLGGYTTFSTFAYESATLWERGEWGPAFANMAGSVAAGFAAVLLGIGVARAIAVPSSERATRQERSGPVAGVVTPQPLQTVEGQAAESEAGATPLEAGVLHGQDDSPGARNERPR
jgi:CrcB protein